MLVLVVDQDEDILASMAFLLKIWGYEVLLARSLHEVRGVVVSHGPRIAAALVDYHLSAHETGLQVAALLHEHLGDGLPVAIVTGDTAPELMKTVRQAKLSLLHKPANAQAVKAFLTAVRRARP